MGDIGLLLTSVMGLKLECKKSGVCYLPDGRNMAVVGHVMMPITIGGVTKTIRVAIIPLLKEQCHLGINFVKDFKVIIDHELDQLFLKQEKVTIQMEMASVEAAPTIASVGIADATAAQREEVRLLAEALLPPPGKFLRSAVGIEHEINVGSARPIKQRYYPVSPKVE